MSAELDPCNGEGWVCEEHKNIPWGNGEGCCGAAGMPCSVCNNGNPPRMNGYIIFDREGYKN